MFSSTFFSKAFNCVINSIILEKLYLIGIRGHLLEWIRGFLSNMKVKLAGSLSGSMYVTSGVPQRSVLELGTRDG